MFKTGLKSVRRNTQIIRSLEAIVLRRTLHILNISSTSLWIKTQRNKNKTDIELTVIRRKHPKTTTRTAIIGRITRFEPLAPLLRKLLTAANEFGPHVNTGTFPHVYCVIVYFCHGSFPAGHVTKREVSPGKRLPLFYIVLLFHKIFNLLEPFN